MYMSSSSKQVVVNINICSMVMVMVMLMMIICHASLPINVATGSSDDDVGKWIRKKINNNKEKITHLHFYFHDWIAPAKNLTAYPVANSSITFTNPNLFGLTYMMDDPLTEGPDPSSKIVGRARGYYGLTGMDDFTMLLIVGFYFSTPKYNGSSVSMLSHNPALHPKRELAVVGGTGKFRLARGVAKAKTLYQDITTGGAVIEYDFYIVHY